ncbi:MAG: hypothetical protein GKS04_00210 [Candidatus Mycalebacterium zealandia]|nr:MAG: hypothetical protein GKS04_00210 [Candidatus Mycalebacterium zealandia]
MVLGFQKKEFQEHFESVSESLKREESDTTDLGRKKIGKIGIGFIAANEICEEVEIYSTCKGSEKLIHVTLNFAEMSKPTKERRAGKKEYKKADYEGEETDDAEKMSNLQRYI